MCSKVDKSRNIFFNIFTMENCTVTSFLAVNNCLLLSASRFASLYAGGTCACGESFSRTVHLSRGVSDFEDKATLRTKTYVCIVFSANSQLLFNHIFMYLGKSHSSVKCKFILGYLLIVTQ